MYNATDYSKEKNRAGWNLFRDIFWLIISLSLSAIAVKHALHSHYDAAAFYLLAGYIVFPFTTKRTL